MQLNNMSIGARLTAVFVVLGGVLIVLAVAALSALGQSNHRLEDFATGINARAQTAAKLRMAVDRRAISVRNMVIAKTPEQSQRQGDQAGAAHQDVQNALSTLQELAKAQGVSDEAKRLIDAIAQTEAKYGPVALAIVDLGRTGRTNEAMNAMNEQCWPLLQELTATTDAYAWYTAQRLKQLNDSARTSYEREKATLLSLVALSLLISLCAGLWVTQSIVKPLKLAVSAADRVASGDLAAEIELRRSDETGQLLGSLDAMRSSLREVVNQVRQSADQIETGTHEIAEGNSDLSARTERQAASLQETSAAMRQLVVSVQSNADSAKEAAALATQASEVATLGSEAVQGVATTMADIAKASGRMTEVVSLIDSVAFQTNILALNAAVEAARAGEQGKGFAVVAAEVRNLASRCAQSAQEIKLLIEESSRQVREGSGRVDAASDTIARVVQYAHNVNQLVARIEQTCDQQSVGIRQVDVAVEQLDEVTQQNAALVEQSAAAAASLSQQANLLVKKVGHFHTSAS